MKKLTILTGNPTTLTEGDLDLFEIEMQVKLSEELREIILLYEGCQINECVFQTEYDSCRFVMINTFLSLQKPNDASIKQILLGHRFYDTDWLIPFAIDPGGYDFNYSIKEDRYGEIWINEFDSGEKEPLKFVASSLSVFLNGLMSQEDAYKLGF